MQSLFNSYREQVLLALKIRTVEQRLLKLFVDGEINGTVHTCVGQEFVPVFLMRHLKDSDYVLSNHRGHGHFLARTGDVTGLIAEVAGRSTGASGGYGGSQHLGAERFYSNGIQGGMTTVATGLAAAAAKQKSIAACFMGDGTLGEGAFYESMNLASRWGLPVLYVIEDNGYAQSTSARQTTAGSVEGRAKAFDIHYVQASTDNLEALNKACEQAVSQARGSGKPTILHVKTQRLNSHSKGDDNRADTELEAYRKQDILNQLLSENIIPDDDIKSIEAEIEAAVVKARAAPVLSHVEKCIPVTIKTSQSAPPLTPSKKRHVEQIDEALGKLLESHADLMIIGEDIEDTNSYTPKNYGGAFKATAGLSTRFPERVRNTPISEAAITGFGVGRALAGLPTIVEIMFGDFSTLAVDAILQHASKFPTIFGKRVALPLMIRTPMGGRRGYGPTHSQSIEKLFLGWPNLTVLAPNLRIDPTALYAAAFSAHDGPSFVVENKLCYGKFSPEKAPLGYEVRLTHEPFPTVQILPKNHKPSVTLVTYGYGLELAEEALALLAEEHDVFVEVVVPTSLCPLNLHPIMESARRTQRVVTIEEGPSFAGFGAEVISSLLNHGVMLRSAHRLGNDTVIPCSLPAELALLPQAADIVSICKEFS